MPIVSSDPDLPELRLYTRVRTVLGWTPRREIPSDVLGLDTPVQLSRARARAKSRAAGDVKTRALSHDHRVLSARLCCRGGYHSLGRMPRIYVFARRTDPNVEASNSKIFSWSDVFVAESRVTDSNFGGIRSASLDQYFFLILVI